MSSPTMKRLGLRPKKRFGQHFLVDENILQAIASSLELQRDDTVLEIGPGTGALTKYILPLVNRLIAVEVDHGLAAYLRATFASCNHFQLIEDDFLRIDCSGYATGEGSLRVIGNIPYNLTSAIIFHVFEQRRWIRDMTLLLQREVAERIVAEPGCKAYGILSVFSRAFADVRILLRVPATVFSPRPKVDSALVQWRFTQQKSLQILDEVQFRRLVRVAFGQRRKMLRKSLSKAFDVERLSKWDLTRRPEELTVSEWVAMANDLHHS